MVQRRLLSLWFPQGLPSGLPNTETFAPDDLTTLALWCQAYSPLTAIDPPDGILIDISGCAHLFGGETAMQAHIQARLRQVRQAIANTATAAWGLARYGETACEDIRPLPLAALRLPAQTIQRLRLVGIRRIAELMRLPRAELTAGYGPEPSLQLARAMGQTPEILHFISTPTVWRKVEYYAEPITAPEQLQAALARLSRALSATLEKSHIGAISIQARFFRVDSHRPEISLGFAAPCRDEFQITKLLHEKLQEIDPGFGIEAISLEASIVERAAPTQRSFTPSAPDFSIPINTLLNRLGSQKLWCATPYASFIPEHAARRTPIKMPPAFWGKSHFPRPVKLLTKPHCITVIAPIPDDPPVLFSWQGKSHKIISATGPERIARDWWCHENDNVRPESEKIRDYYEVQDSQGARFWLFRAGLHNGELRPRWYLHGFFA